MQRRPSTQDITWLLDLNQNSQLDLMPPYQRRSVWTKKDRQFFLDTIFRNYPSPAIFLHKTISELGKATYHVVDGKQRIQTILDFSNNLIRIGKDFGDTRLDGKKWSELNEENDLKQKFWNYQITVEMIDFEDITIVNEVFDRLNRNARKLTNQELRHAKFDGWLISQAESESSKDIWKLLGISTTARSKRMLDTQFISEIMLVVLEKSIIGFDQDSLDEFYAKYDDPADTLPEFDPEPFEETFEKIKSFILEMEKNDGAITKHARGYGHFYSLWGSIAHLVQSSSPLPPNLVAEKYSLFMKKVELLAQQKDITQLLSTDNPDQYSSALNYLNNSRGASTDYAQRNTRHLVLVAELEKQ